eukprot:scaffold48708_cov63-Phaeocystis_antarctica.AAC.6
MDRPVIVFFYQPTTHAELPLRVRVAARCAAVRASRQLPLAKLPAEILLKLIGTLVARPTHTPQKRLPTGRTHAGMPVKPAPCAHSTRIFVIGCHAAEISDSGGVHTEINLNSGRRERFAKLPKSLGARRSGIFTEDEPSPHKAELRGGLVCAGVYPLKNIRHRNAWLKLLGPGCGGVARRGAVGGAGGGVAARGGALHLGVAGLRGRLPQRGASATG